MKLRDTNRWTRRLVCQQQVTEVSQKQQQQLGTLHLYKPSILFGDNEGRTTSRKMEYTLIIIKRMIKIR